VGGLCCGISSISPPGWSYPFVTTLLLVTTVSAWIRLESAQCLFTVVSLMSLFAVPSPHFFFTFGRGGYEGLRLELPKLPRPLGISIPFGTARHFFLLASFIILQFRLVLSQIFVTVKMPRKGPYERDSSKNCLILKVCVFKSGIVRFLTVTKGLPDVQSTAD